MKVLLDTSVLLWVTYDAPRLSARARAIYADPSTELYISVVSLWEITVKSQIGKLPLPGTLEELLAPLRDVRAASVLPLTESAVLRLRSLPALHRDPFDRMLICQAIDEGLALLTPDAHVRAYPVTTEW